MTEDNDKPKEKTLGEAIDAIVAALQAFDTSTREKIIRASCDLLAIAPPIDSLDRSDRSVDKSSSARRTESVRDVRELKEQKNPSSANEMAALVAFYLSEQASQAERKDTVEVSDMVQYFKQAKFKLPKATRQILHNAKNAGYFDSAGEGKFKLNAVGYNLVEHGLPRPSITATTRRRRSTKKQTIRRGKR